MASKLRLLPKNTIKICNKVLSNSRIVKMIDNSTNRPFDDTSVVNGNSLFMSKVFPFQDTYEIAEMQTQIRIFFPKNVFPHGSIIEEHELYFDIIVHRDLFLMYDENNKSTLRPDEIAAEIAEMFDKVTMDGIGTMRIMERRQLVANEYYHIVRLCAEFTTFAK